MLSFRHLGRGSYLRFTWVSRRYEKRSKGCGERSKRCETRCEERSKRYKTRYKAYNKIFVLLTTAFILCLFPNPISKYKFQKLTYSKSENTEKNGSPQPPIVLILTLNSNH